MPPLVLLPVCPMLSWTLAADGALSFEEFKELIVHVSNGASLPPVRLFSDFCLSIAPPPPVCCVLLCGVLVCVTKS